jgi:predicted O-methyltransferase YrrM
VEPNGVFPDPRLASIRGVLERLERDGTAVADTDATVHDIFPVAIPAGEGEALRSWIVREGAARTIEVGLGYGVAALFACEGLLSVGAPGALHLAVDPKQASRFADVGLQLLREAGVRDLVEFHARGSEIALPGLLAEGRTFDLAFVDGNHRFDAVFVDLVYLDRLVRPGGVVLVDDHQLPSVRHAARFCTSNLGWTLEEDSTADPLHHWAVLRTARTPLERPIHHFVEFWLDRDPGR